LVNATIKAVTTVEGFFALSGGDPIDYRQTAQDGVQFSFENFVAQPIMKFANTGKPRRASFAPGNRMDLLVKAPATPGLHQFRLNDTADPISSLKDVVTVRVEGTAVQMSFPAENDYPKLPRFLADIQASDITPQATPRPPLDFGWDPKKIAPGPDGPKAPRLTINGKQFDGHDYDQEMVLNAVEEWTLENSTDTIRHPFHIHVNPFQVVEIFDPTAPIDERTYAPSGNYIWQDVIAIPPATFNPDGTVKEKGRVRIRHRFVDFVGSYVLHCHMLSHEDRGMMQLVRVVPTAADLGTKKVIPHH